MAGKHPTTVRPRRVRRDVNFRRGQTGVTLSTSDGATVTIVRGVHPYLWVGNRDGMVAAIDLEQLARFFVPK